MRPLLALLHPCLPALDSGRRWALLRAATAEPFDAFELVALAATVILAAWRGPGAMAFTGLAAVVACLLLRRMRRGLDRRFPE